MSFILQTYLPIQEQSVEVFDHQFPPPTIIQLYFCVQGEREILASLFIKTSKKYKKVDAIKGKGVFKISNQKAKFSFQVKLYIIIKTDIPHKNLIKNI